MTQEEKQILLQDLCARLPYRVKIGHIGANKKLTGEPFVFDIEDYKNSNPLIIVNSNWLPYLRPMSSMTEEEKNEIKALGAEFSPLGNIRFRIEDEENDGFEYGYKWLDIFDFLNEHHFDYRGLIKKGLALEAPEGMYNLKEK